MAIQYPDSVADAAGSIRGPYNITASNDQFSVNVDGSGTQTFSLTQGSARTAAQVVTDLAGLTGATASAANVGEGNTVVRIRTTSASGNSSTILFNAPANNSNTVLGFVATTYKGGVNTEYCFTGSTKQKIADGIETALLTAGWITVSGSGTTNVVMQSSLSPAGQNLRCKLRMKDNSGTQLQLTLENAWGTKVMTSSTSFGGCLKPIASGARLFTVIACKYQFFVFVEGNVWVHGTNVQGGIPFIPSFLEGVLWEAFWLHGMNGTDSATFDGTFSTFRVTRDRLQAGASGTLTNGVLWETVSNSVSSGIGGHSLWDFRGLSRTPAYKWVDLSTIIFDPLISWGLTSHSDEGMIRGQLWSAFMSTDPLYFDEILTSVNGHNWKAYCWDSKPQLVIATA